MIATTKIDYKTLGDYAFHGMKKHLKKIEKWEASVKKDEDPEALHQMRVGMRRLRSVVGSLGFAVELPPSVSDRNIGKIGRRLGSLRDLDVLQEKLETHYRPFLPAGEQKFLKKALTKLEKQRLISFKVVEQTLKSNRYKLLKQDLENWLLNPIYKPIALMSINFSVQDLLLPEVSKFLLDSGWLVGLEIDGEAINGNSQSKLMLATLENREELNTHLIEHHNQLHHLRKQAKRLRYQMELFSELYAEDYQVFLNDIKNVQEILGNLQDSIVLDEWLSDVMGEKWYQKMPHFQEILLKQRCQDWQQWQTLHTRYMQHVTREQFHGVILNLKDRSLA